MSHLELNQTFVIEAAPNTGGADGCDVIVVDTIFSCSGETSIKLNTDNISINQTLLPVTNTIDLGTPVKRFRSLNTFSGSSSYWTTNVVTAAVINVQTINLGIDNLNNTRVLTANSTLLLGDSLGGQVY